MMAKKPKGNRVQRYFLKFSPLATILPCVEPRLSETYKTAKQNILKILDIERIVELYDELEKLKAILLSREERSMMRFLARPEIRETSRNRDEPIEITELQSEVSLEKMTPEMLSSLQADYDKVRHSATEVSRRLLALIDPEVKAYIDTV
eukprot:TRINITY_DN6967_c0_g1_i2.p1 TRINITY_DN6967_c0_g1~~TRINITY_DN6967_c0_g1_i2.p1  ORF type:complete len:150 (+),score=26.84 TRINITY_DN6967_c0_g1_i2:264-713(+)